MIETGADLLKLLPPVLRARDFHLYLDGGKRLVDLWLAGGKAVLGHKPPRVIGELKNASERGLFTPLPHPSEGRFIKALCKLFPNRFFRLYKDSFSMHRALAEAGLQNEFSPIDPAYPESAAALSAKSVSLWRPFLEQPALNNTSNCEAPILIPVLPWPLGPDVLVLDKNEDASVKAGEKIPPVLLAPASRAVYDLLAEIKKGSRLARRYPIIEKALGKAKSGDGGNGGCIWRRNGIYLTVKPDMETERYEVLFRHFLDGGFLIPPSPSEPAILPLSMSKGEESKLAELLGFC